MKLATGVNFTNILCAAFIHEDPKCAKKTDNLYVIFALLGSAWVNAACKMLVKSTPECQQNIISMS